MVTWVSGEIRYLHGYKYKNMTCFCGCKYLSGCSLLTHVFSMIIVRTVKYHLCEKTIINKRKKEKEKEKRKNKKES